MKVAVIGGGISGLGCAWLLSQKYQVHLFESEKRLGGHAHTVEVKENSQTVPVDTGFLVYNELTYPHLTAFFKTLGVETAESNMSLSVQARNGKLEWGGENLNTVFGQRSNLLKPYFYQMLYEILRFGREAEDNLKLARRHAWSLADLLKVRKYAQGFINNYLLPMGAAIWSTPEKKMLDFPASTFLIFFINHKLLQVNHRPVWRTVKNGSIEYVKKVAQQIHKIYLNTPVMSVERVQGKVLVKTVDSTMEFDKVVLATHAPITASILKPHSEFEFETLSSIKYAPNKAILHTDSQCMPKRKRVWSSWNVLGVDQLESAQQVSLNYYINMLQPIEAKRDYFVSLNPKTEIKNILGEYEYWHPQFDQRAILAQHNISQLQGQGGVYFAGAWQRYGFHEDGLLSGVNVAQRLGVKTPWGF